MIAPVVSVAGQGASADQAAASAVPRLVRFSGVLRDSAAKPGKGLNEVTFSLYRDESGGESLWFETQTVEVDAQGRYTVLLGAMHPDGLPMDLFTSGEARWLGVSVGKLPEQARVLLVSVPYALKAGDAETLAGKPATAFVASEQLKQQVQSEVKAQAAQSGTAKGTRTLIGTAPSPQALGEGQASFACNLSADCVAVTQSGTGVALHATAGSNVAIFGETASTSGRGLYGLATAATGGTIGVWGSSYSTSGIGMSGRVTATTGATNGMYGVSFSTSGIGVHGDAPATSGATRGVWGSNGSTGGIAVWGQAYAASGTTYGVLGTVASPSGIGASGQANAASGTTIGVLAKVLSGSGTALVANNTAGGVVGHQRGARAAQHFRQYADGRAARGVGLS